MSERIQDMPEGERPREKLIRLGPGALSNAELLALFISSGNSQRNAIQIGQDLLARYGSMAALGTATVPMLQKEYGIGKAKACNLAAAFELGARVARERVQTLPLDSPERVYECYGPQFGHLTQEQVVVIPVNARLQHMATDIVSVGSVNEASAHPREILRPVITRGAYGFVLLHNHPSGDPGPSQADEAITRRLAEAAKLMQLRFLDHVIIGRPAAGRAPYFSFREAGLLG